MTNILLKQSVKNNEYIKKYTVTVIHILNNKFSLKYFEIRNNADKVKIIIRMILKYNYRKTYIPYTQTCINIEIFMRSH